MRRIYIEYRPMKLNFGSSYPLFPRTGYVRYERESVDWEEEDLENWNLYFTFLGKGVVRSKQETWELPIGSLDLFPPHMPRRYRVAEASEGWGFYFLHFEPTTRLTEYFSAIRTGNPLRFKIADRMICSRIVSSLDELLQINLAMPDAPERVDLMNALIETILFRAIRNHEARETPAWKSADIRIIRALEHFHHDLSKRHTIDALSRIAGLSRSQFCNLFRAGIGMSAQQYMEERRMELARYYLSTTQNPVGEIAANVGFADPLYFSNRFKQRYLLSPSEFRNANPGHSGIDRWTPPLKRSVDLELGSR